LNGFEVMGEIGHENSGQPRCIARGCARVLGALETNEGNYTDCVGRQTPAKSHRPNGRLLRRAANL
jgi:hypothetical protein